MHISWGIDVMSKEMEPQKNGTKQKNKNLTFDNSSKLNPSVLLLYTVPPGHNSWQPNF